MTFVGVTRGRNGALVIFKPQKLPVLFTMQPHKQMHHHKQGGGVWAAKTTTITRSTGLRLQLICTMQLICLPSFLIMIKQNKIPLILKTSTLEATWHLLYSAQMFISSTKSTLEIQSVSDLTSIRHNTSQTDSVTKPTAKTHFILWSTFINLLQHIYKFKVNPELTITLILGLTVTTGDISCLAYLLTCLGEVEIL